MRTTILVAALGILAAGGCLSSRDRQPAADTRTARELIRDLAGEIPEQRLEAARALAARGPGVVPALTQALGDKNSKVRRGATDALAAMKADAKAAVPALVEALNDQDPWVRAGAAEALGSIGPEAEDAAAALAQAAGDRDLWVRESALAALARGQVTTDTELLLGAAVRALTFPDTGWSAKRYALDLLDKHGKQHKPAIPALLYTLEHRSEGMWDGTPRVVELLDGMGAADKAVPTLIKLLESENRGTPRKACESLGKIGKAAAPAVPALKALAEKSDDERIRDAARTALEQIEGETPK